MLLISCKSDDVEPARTATGSFKIDNATYGLSQGFFTNSELDSPGLFYNAVILTDSGFELIQNSELVGRGNAVALEIYTAASNNNLVGTYTITDDTPVAGQAYGYYLVNFDTDSGTSDDEEDLMSGTLTISLNTDGTYKVTLTNGRVDITNQSFQMSFDGKLSKISE